MTQLSFSIRATASCKSVHLVGSWDGYAGQLPLAKAKGSKKDAWAGTFRFNASVIRDGERYWYYYIIDGYHVAHDPACDSTVEPKTGRRLNLLVVKDGAAVKRTGTAKGGVTKGVTTKSSSGSAAKTAPLSSHSARRHARHGSVDVPCGRPVSPSKICAPQPVKPAAVASPRAASAVSAAQVSEAGSTTVAHLAAQLEHTRLADERRAALGDGEDWDEWASGSECGGSDTSRSSLGGGARSSSSCSGSDVESESDVASLSIGSSASSRSSNAGSPTTPPDYGLQCSAAPANAKSANYVRQPVAAVRITAADEDSEFDSDSDSD